MKTSPAPFPRRDSPLSWGLPAWGKTTLFRILLGLEKPDSGVIFGMEGKTLSVVFQEDRLFPDLTVLQNAEVAGTNGEAWLARLGLQSELSAYPQSLSGGMRRRVSIAGRFAETEMFFS